MSFFIHSLGDRRIEARLNISKKPNAPLALIVHPDPNLGGNMDNPVIVASEKILFAEGFSTLCFNYAIKQESALCKNGERLPDFLDISIVLDWAMQERSEFRHFWIMGVAYGSYLALQATMRRPEILHFIAASVPVTQCDLGFLAPCPVPGLVLQSSQDAQLLTATEAWTQRLSQGAQKVTLQTLTESEHCLEKSPQFAQSIQQYVRSIDLLTGLPKTA